MKKTFLTVFLVLSLFVPQAHSEAPLGPDEFTSVDELALAIAAYFPKVQGEVKAVSAGQLTIGLGKKDGIIPGMILTLWRDGKEILHPVTKAVIGRVEDEVGTVEVQSVNENSSAAIMKKQLKEPKSGDRARITPRKINIAVLPLRTERPEIIEGLVERLNELGRFSVVETQKMNAFLKDKKQRDAALIKDIGAAFTLDAVVAVAIFPSEGKYLTTTRIYYADETKPLDTIVAVLNLTSKREALGDVRPFFAPVRETKLSGEKTPDLPVEARYFSVADFDGDKTNEFVFSDGKKISVWRLGSDGWKAVWTETLPSKERSAQQFGLSAADINGNGKAEIFVTRMLDGTVTSSVFEFSEGSFHKTFVLPGFLRVLTVPGKGSVLIGQEYSASDLFKGSPKEYVWTGESYASTAVMAAPKGVNIYNFALANLGEAQPLLVAFDKNERLMIYSGDTVLWKSEEEYHAVQTSVLKPLSGLDAVLGRNPTDMDRAVGNAVAGDEKNRQVRISGRIIAADLSGNGTDDVVVARNTPLSLLGGYSGGEVNGLVWTGARLNPRWSVKDLPGPALDIQVVSEQKGGYQVYTLVQESGGLFKKDRFWIEKYQAK